jgi:NAD(P)-dependent dehydrogenase (short-subunit alcohol dehydrogenase family)
MTKLYRFFAAFSVILVSSLSLPVFSVLVSSAGSVLLCVHLSYTLLRWYRQNVNSLTIPCHQRLVVVTGCDSGIGLQTARRFDYAGFHVLAGCRDVRSDGARDLQQFTSKRLRVVPLDETNDEQIDRLVEMVEYLTNQKSPRPRLRPDLSGGKVDILEPRFPKPMFTVDGELHLWALINSADSCKVAGPFESMSYADLEKDIKSVVQITQSMLHFLQRSKGRIVNVGSMTGPVTIANSIAYSMCKSAVRSLTVGLAAELAPLSVKCSLVEPTASIEAVSVQKYAFFCTRTLLL